jgi:DNA-binding NtrC family response regulator
MSIRTILILDKEYNTRWTLKAFLESEKYIVVAVNTIEKALQQIGESVTSGLITEYWIDHARTLEIIREVRRRFPEIYILMLTNTELLENEYEEIIDAGVDDYFLKPLSNKKVLLHLRKGLMQRDLFIQRKGLDRGWIKSNSDDTFMSLQK